MSAKYFYTVKGVRQEPVTLEELSSLAQRQELKRSDLVWTEGMAAWQQAGSTVEIFKSLPPDLRHIEQKSSLIPPPPEAKTGGSHSEPKPFHIGVGIIVLVVAILIMLVIHQKQKAEQDTQSSWMVNSSNQKYSGSTIQPPPVSQEEQDYQQAKCEYEASLASSYRILKDTYPNNRETLQDFIQEAYRELGPLTHEEFVKQWQASKQRQ